MVHEGPATPDCVTSGCHFLKKYNSCMNFALDWSPNLFHGGVYIVGTCSGLIVNHTYPKGLLIRPMKRD